MTYVAKTFTYLARSFRLLVPVALVPALLLGIFLRPLGFITFIPDYSVTPVDSFGDIAWLMFSRYSVTYVYPILLIFAVLTLACALSLSVVEKHFRVGRLMFKASVRDVNSSIFPALKTLSVMSGVYLLWKFLLCGIVTLLHFIMSGQGVPTTINVIITSVVVTALLLLTLFFCVPALLWAPLMLTFGYSFTDAFIESARLSGKELWKLFTALIFPFAVVTVLQCAVEFLPLHIIAAKAISVVLYTFLIVYIVSFMMIAAFDLTGLERRDKKKSFV